MHSEFVDSATNMLRYIVFCFIIFNIQKSLSAPTISTRVQIRTGLIEGNYEYSNLINKSYYAFRGIPYAEPPLGKLRFQPAVRPKSWTGVLETKNDKPKCMQWSGGSEDCLYITVYTPSLPSTRGRNKLLPVMVYIYGGGFIQGSSSLYNPSYLVDKNVLLVIPNWRLNVFGFLNARNDAAPGNIGLKDQIFALHWIQENIERFNGNKNMITIFGHSAGSAAVQYLVQTKLARGLIHRAILQSGTTFNNWALEDDPIDLIHQFGRVLNMDTRNLTDFVHRLHDIPCQELYTASANRSLWTDHHKLIRSRFIPSIERNTPNAFLPESSYSLVSTDRINNVPILMGYLTGEAKTFIRDIATGKSPLDEFQRNPYYLIPLALNIQNDTNRMNSVLREITNYYFKDVPYSNETAFLHYQSSENFVRGIRKTAELLRQHTDIYFYIFGYKDYSDTSPYPGVSHVGELRYIWFNFTGVEEIPEDKVMSRKLTTLWANFAAGNPTPVADPLFNNVRWPKVSRNPRDHIRYVYIAEQMSIRENPDPEEYAFWERIFRTYGRTPFSIY